ncbi:hypothetical protein [Rosistilla oblonga]
MTKLFKRVEETAKSLTGQDTLTDKLRAWLLKFWIRMKLKG